MKSLRVKWTGELVDIYTNNTKSLVGLVGYLGRGLDHSVKLAFVLGFPDDVSVVLQQVPAVEKNGPL